MPNPESVKEQDPSASKQNFSEWTSNSQDISAFNNYQF